MKKKIYSFALVITVVLAHFSCEFGVEEDIPEITDVTVSGQIVESISGDPVLDASVKITDGISQVNATTQPDGTFTSIFPLAEDGELTIIAFKAGYNTDTLKVFATVGSTVAVPLIKIDKMEGSGSSSSGGPASIYMFAQSSQSIGVKESGSNETAQIIFEVLDSTGAAISSDESILVRFSFGSSPGGGEYLYPLSVVTNALGRASVTINTGTVAGVAQVIAQMVVNNVTIRSKPVLISINGGFPDQNHFAVAAEKLNYPAYGIIGFEIPFTAFIGDKYTNPVRPGTSVYFSTTSGIIEGSNLTDDLGRSTVTLLTQPFPNHTTFGPGFFEVTASTINENNVNIQTESVRLLSGLPLISVEPSTFNIPNGGSQFFNYTVSDGNSNPLSEGTAISVRVTEGDLKVSGDVDIRLPDTQSSAYTLFSFTAYDAKPDTVNSLQAIIEIATSGPNGDKKISITGTAE